MKECRSVATPMEVNFQLDEAPVATGIPYRKLVCSLMYLTVTTRPNLAFSVSYLSQLLDIPTLQTWKAVKSIQYLCATRNLGLYKKSSVQLERYSETD